MRSSLMCPSRGAPFEGGDPTELQDQVLGLLEAAGIDTATCDQIMKLIDAAERRLAPADPEAMGREERDHAQLQELQEIADGAWGDDPAARGRARDMLLAARSAGGPASS